MIRSNKPPEPTAVDADGESKTPGARRITGSERLSFFVKPRSMRYSQIDPVLFPWAKTHGLHVYTKCRDDEIRSIEIVDDTGDCYALGTMPNDDGLVEVWVSEKRVAGRPLVSGKFKTQSFTTPVGELEQILESAYRQAEIWISERGHTRTPVL
jgi:hypothetical protein